jgi:hypothetical protein
MHLGSGCGIVVSQNGGTQRARRSSDVAPVSSFEAGAALQATPAVAAITPKTNVRFKALRKSWLIGVFTARQGCAASTIARVVLVSAMSTSPLTFHP